MNLSSMSVKVLAAAMLLASTTGLVFAKNYKGEYNYKGEAEVAPCPPPLMLKDGFYIGAQAGYDSFRAHTTFVNPELTTATNLALTGWVGGLFLGYGQYFNNMYYLAGEILGNYNGSSAGHSFSDEDGDNFNATVKARGTWGLALIPGLRLNPTSLGYVRLGYDWTNFRASGSAFDGATGTAVSASNNKTEGGFTWGLGIETLLWDNWSVRTEYNHMYYSNFSSNGLKIDPSDNQFMVGVLYHFA